MRFVLGFVRLLGRLVGGTLLLIYMIASRSLVVVMALYLTLYFLLGARPVKDLIQQAISDAVPGTIGACGLQWGPLPWHVRIAEGRIFGSRGEEIIRVRGVEATIDLGKTLDNLIAFVGDSAQHPMHIQLERVDLLEPWARVEVRDDGWIGLERAFVDYEAAAKPSDGEAFAFALDAEVVRVLDASGRVDAPGFHLTASGLDTVTNYAMRFGDNDFDMAFDIPRIDVPAVDITFTSFNHLAEPLHVSARHVMVEDVAWRRLGFTWRDARGLLGDDAHGHFQGSGAIDGEPAIVTWRGVGSVSFDDSAYEVRTLSGGNVVGPLDFSIAGGGDIEQLRASWGLTSPELSIASMLLRDVSAQGRFEPRGSPAVPDRHALFIDAAEGSLGGGRVSLDAFAYDPRTDDSDARDLAFALRVEDVDVGSALVALFGADVPYLPPAAWSGGASIALHPHPEVQGDTLVIAVDEAEVVWRSPPLPGVGATWTVAGRAERSSGVTALRHGSQLGPFDRLDVRGLVIDAGADRVRLAGTLDMLTGVIDLEPYARVGDIAPMARMFGRGDLAGRLVLKAAHARGTLLDPRVDGTVNWTGARIGPRELGQVQGTLALTGGKLGLRNVVSDSNTVGFALDASLDLFDPGWRLTRDLAFHLETHKLQGLLASAIGPWLGHDARIAIEAGDVSGSLRDLPFSLQGGGRLLITNASIAGESGVRIAATVTAKHASRDSGALQLDALTVTFQNGAVWNGRLRLVRPRSGEANTALEGSLEIGDTSLANLRPIAQAVPDLSGILRGRLTFGGTVAHPVIIGTVELEDAIVGSLVLGDALLSVTTQSDTVEISAFDRDLFGGFSLERAALTLDGFSPRRFEAIVRANKKDLGDLVPEFRDSAVDLVGSAAAEIEVDVPSGAVSFRIKARPQELELSVPDRGVRWTNQSELLLVSDEGRFRMYPVSLAPVGRTGSDTPHLEACGRIDRERLDLQLAGTVDLAIVPGLSDLFSVADGRIRIAPDAVAARTIGDDTCLQNTTSLLLLGGSVSAPVAVGSIELLGLTLVPRGSGREVRLRTGDLIQLRQGARPGLQRILLGSEDNRFEGELDDGSFGLSGELSLNALTPSSLDLRLVGADLFIQSPGEFAFTASPNARLVGANLDSPNPNLALSGDVTLSDGRFSKSFDTFARAVGGALGVKSDAYQTSILEDLPWLGGTRLDVNVIASDFQIQTALPLARTDLPARLDLTLRGTIAAPRLFRRIDLLPGGTLTYLVFERTFTVSQGAVDFDGDPERPLVEVTAQSQITYLQRAQTTLQEEDEKDVTVTLRMSGRVPDLKIELSSDDPTLDQADIQSLLITGKPRGDLDRAQESRVVSADLANVINTVLSAPFVRTASVGVDQKGGLEYRVGTCFAPNLCFDTTTVSDDTETTLRAKFSLSIGDDVVCEGTLKRSDTGATTAQETYEARCRYRIPLE